MRSRGSRLAVPVALGVALVLAGCAGDGSGGAGTAEAPAGGSRTITPVVVPRTGPPAGELVADLRQSSLDAAAGQFQVWIGNGLGEPVTPMAISYADPRFRAPVSGERLREIPDGYERGFPLALPARPVCGSRATTGTATGTVTVTYGDGERSVEVTDEARIVERYVANRCFELATRRVASLSVEDAVAVDRPGEGSVGTLVLVVTPSGRPGHVMTIDTVGGTPLLTPHRQPVWSPDVTVASDGAPQRIELPVVPARCDEHVFMEGGGSTAYRVRLRLDGPAGERPGELVVRMSPTGARNAIAFARDSCGLG